MSEIRERSTSAICSKCGSEDVECTEKYFTTGGDMEYVDFKHACRTCGHVETETQQGCYGFDHEYTCGLKHKQMNK